MTTPQGAPARRDWSENVEATNNDDLDWGADFSSAPNPSAPLSIAAAKPSSPLKLQPRRTHDSPNDLDDLDDHDFDDDEEQGDTIKQSQLPSSTLDQLKEASARARAATSASQPATATAGVITHLQARKRAPESDLSGLELDGLDDGGATKAEDSLAARLSRFSRRSHDGSATDDDEDDDFDFDDEGDEDLFAGSSGGGGDDHSRSSTSNNSASLSGRRRGGAGGGAASSTDEAWTEPESPTPSLPESVEHSSASGKLASSSFPPAITAAGGVPKHLLDRLSPSATPSLSLSPGASAALRRAASRTFPRDQASDARLAGLLGVDAAPGSAAAADLEADFDIDDGVGQLTLSPLLRSKASDASVSGTGTGDGKGGSSNAKSRAPVRPQASFPSSGSSSTSSGAGHRRHWSSLSASSISQSHISEEASASASVSSDAEPSSDRPDGTLDGLVIPAGPMPAANPLSNERATAHGGSLNAASMNAMLKARRRGAYNASTTTTTASGSASTPPHHRGVSAARPGGGGVHEDLLSGLVIDDDGDLSAQRLRARRYRNPTGPEQALSPQAGRAEHSAGKGNARRRAQTGPQGQGQGQSPAQTGWGQHRYGAHGGSAAPTSTTSSPPSRDGSQLSATAAPFRPRFAPAAQIFQRALASTEAFKDRMLPFNANAGGTVVRPGPPPRVSSLAHARVRPQSAQSEPGRAGEQPRRGGGAVRLTVPTGRQVLGNAAGAPVQPSAVPFPSSSASAFHAVPESLPMRRPQSQPISHRQPGPPGRLAMQSIQQALGAPLSLPRKPSQQVLQTAAALAHERSVSQSSETSTTGSTTHTQPHSQRKRNRKKRAPRKLTLIRNFGGPPAEEKVVGGMRWDPIAKQWEGNEAEMKRFDEVAAPSPSRLALISPMRPSASAAGGAAAASPTGTAAETKSPSPAGKPPLMGSATNAIVGEMKFDPVRMCWTKIGDEEEEDVFADLSGDSDGEDWTEPSARSRSTLPSGGSAALSDADAHDFPPIPLPENFAEICRQAELLHVEQMAYLLEADGPDRAHLFLRPSFNDDDSL